MEHLWDRVKRQSRPSFCRGLFLRIPFLFVAIRMPPRKLFRQPLRTDLFHDPRHSGRLLIFVVPERVAPGPSSSSTADRCRKNLLIPKRFFVYINSNILEFV